MFCDMGVFFVFVEGRVSVWLCVCYMLVCSVFSVGCRLMCWVREVGRLYCYWCFCSDVVCCCWCILSSGFVGVFGWLGILCGCFWFLVVYWWSSVMFVCCRWLCMLCWLVWWGVWFYMIGILKGWICLYIIVL